MKMDKLKKDDIQLEKVVSELKERLKYKDELNLNLIQRNRELKAKLRLQLSLKSELTEKSKEQVDNIAKILKDFPKATIKLGGYTDNTGSVDANNKISAERANFVKNELVKAGIAASRISAEGYGPQHPICAANDTKECQAQNRRVDIRVTNK